MAAQFRRFPNGGNDFTHAPKQSAAVRRGVEVEIRYALRLPRDLATVPLVRTICRDAMNRLGVTADCQGDVALALTEACANVVQHAGGDSEYEVAIAFIETTCHIRVIDRGHGIDLTDSNRTETILENDSGRGIVLMKLLVDRIAFQSQPEDGTIVHLQKRLELHDGALLTAL
jgi:serine/threonine-protein kinase RsbW